MESAERIRPVGQGVKTSPSHGENTGSIPVLAANNSGKQMIRISVLVIFFARSNDVGQSINACLK